MPRSRVTGIVLAAGSSRRLGTPKQLLAEMHGDKGVRRMVESGRYNVRRIPIDDVVPLDVDTWDDYKRLLASAAR